MLNAAYCQEQCHSMEEVHLLPGTQAFSANEQ